MEERITLDGRIARIHYTFRNTGPGATDHPATSQEMPAVFVDYALKNLVYYDGSSPWTGGPLRRDVPGWPNEERTRTEHWAAYVDDSDWGRARRSRRLIVSTGLPGRPEADVPISPRSVTSPSRRGWCSSTTFICI